MKTQVSILVKNENWISRCMSIYMSLGLFVKAKVKVYVDGAETNPIVLKARKEPYIIDVEPGAHSFVFEAKSRAKVDKFIGGAMAGTVGLGFGGTINGMLFAKGGSDFTSGIMGHSKVQENLLECELQEGDVLKVSIKPKRNGAVKVKLL